MGSQTFLLAFVCFLAFFQAFECKTLGRERKVRSYVCKPSKGDSCQRTICEGNKQTLVTDCICPNMINFRCPCVDHNGRRFQQDEKFIYQFNGESLYCGCDMKDSGYCKRGCVDNDGKKYGGNETHYEFEGANGKYSCDCKSGTAKCSKGFTLPDIDSGRPPPVIPPRPVLPPLPGMPGLPPRFPPLPPQLPPLPPHLPPRP